VNRPPNLLSILPIELGRMTLELSIDPIKPGRRASELVSIVPAKFDTVAAQFKLNVQVSSRT
jgi:hypothetical protein